MIALASPDRASNRTVNREQDLTNCETRAMEVEAHFMTSDLLWKAAEVHLQIGDVPLHSWKEYQPQRFCGPNNVLPNGVRVCHDHSSLSILHAHRGHDALFV